MSAEAVPARCVPLPVSGADPEIDPTVWYARGLRFECTQCGNCCTGSPGYVWVTMEDMDRMAAFLRMPFDEFTRRYVRQVGGRYSLIERQHFDCVFLTRDGTGKTGCAVYGVRPTQCRTWPFWTENVKSESAWERAGAGCPGIRGGTGPVYGLGHIERCRQHPESP
jgi:uncharacterized protein